MAELADLFLSEKNKSLLLMALDTHIREMVDHGCCQTAVEMFFKLEDWVRDYDTQLSAAAITMIEQYGEEIETIEDDREAEARELVDELDDEDAMLLYEALCERLGAAPDVDVPNDKLKELLRNPSIFDDPRQFDLEEAIRLKQEELNKLKASQVPTDVNPNEFYPCDVEPSAFIDSVFGDDASRVHPLFSRRR